MYNLTNQYNNIDFRLNEKKLLKTQNQAKLITTDFNVLYNNFLTRLTNIYVNRFVWDNLPIEIEPWFLERSLLMNGVCVFFYDEIINEYLITFVNLSGEMNVYNIPQKWKAYAANGYSRNLCSKNAVIIYNNNDFMPDFNTLCLYAERMAYIYVIYMKNIALQKNSISIATTKDTLLSSKNIVNQIDEGKDYIFIKDMFDVDKIKPINLQVEFKADRLRAELRSEFNDFLNWCGIESFTSDKKERLVSGEASGNNGYVEIQRNIGLNARKLAERRINNMFNLELNVKFNSEIATLVNLGSDYISEIIQKGGAEIE